MTLDPRPLDPMPCSIWVMSVEGGEPERKASLRGGLGFLKIFLFFRPMQHSQRMTINISTTTSTSNAIDTDLCVVWLPSLSSSFDPSVAGTPAELPYAGLKPGVLVAFAGFVMPEALVVAEELMTGKVKALTKEPF